MNKKTTKRAPKKAVKRAAPASKKPTKAPKNTKLRVGAEVSIVGIRPKQNGVITYITKDDFLPSYEVTFAQGFKNIKNHGDIEATGGMRKVDRPILFINGQRWVAAVVEGYDFIMIGCKKIRIKDIIRVNASLLKVGVVRPKNRL
jgi:hypothetical protein